jgi:hypothetical protein
MLSFLRDFPEILVERIIPGSLDPGRGANDLSPDPKGFLRPELLAGKREQTFPLRQLFNSPPE